MTAHLQPALSAAIQLLGAAFSLPSLATDGPSHWRNMSNGEGPNVI